MLSPSAKSRLIAAGFSVLFIAFVITIFVIGARGIVTVSFAILLFVALLGLYLGIGVLVAVYRFVAKLQ